MRQFVREHMRSERRSGREGAVAKKELFSHGYGARIKIAGDLVPLRPVVHANILERVTKATLHGMRNRGCERSPGRGGHGVPNWSLGDVAASALLRRVCHEIPGDVD